MREGHAALILIKGRQIARWPKKTRGGRPSATHLEEAARHPLMTRIGWIHRYCGQGGPCLAQFYQLGPLGRFADPQDFLLHLGHACKADFDCKVATCDHGALGWRLAAATTMSGKVRTAFAVSIFRMRDRHRQSLGRRSANASWSIFTSSAARSRH